MERARIIVDGEVQGVGYRYLVRRAARRSQLLGYARNMKDGRVEVVVEGNKERVKRFIDMIRVKKPPIEVSETQVEFLKATDEFETFTIVTGNLKEEVVEGFSTGASYFEVTFQKQDQMLEKQDETLKEIKHLRSDLRTLLEERLTRLERDIAVIKAKLSLE